MGKSSNSTSSSTRSGVNYVDGLAEGLPMGWKVEIKARGSGSTVGRKYKCYIAPVTGRKLYSKGEVSRYLNSRPQQERSVLTQSETQEVTKESDTVDELPPGLPLEVKVRKKVDTIRSNLKLNGNLEKGEFIFGECSESEDTVKAEPMLESLTVEGGESAESTKVVSLDAKSSKKRKGRKASVKEGPLSTQPTNVSRSEKQLLENGVGEHEKRKFQLGSRKRKNKIDLSTPRRASKRLAGINAELPSEVDRPIVDIHMAPVPIAGNAELASEVERPNWATHLVPVPIDGTNVELASEVKRPNTHIVPVPMAGTDAELATDVERTNRAPQLAQINAELVSDVERLDGVISVASVAKRLAGTNAALASDVERPNGAPRVTTLPKQLAEVSADIPSDVERPNGIPQVATVPKQLAGINAELASVVERPNGAPQVETVPKQLDGINANLALDVGRLNGTAQVETVPKQLVEINAEPEIALAVERPNETPQLATVPEQLEEITPELASDVGRSNEVPQVETVPKQLAGIKAELGSDIERPNETLQVAPVPPPPEDNMAVNSTSGGTACLVFEQSNQHESEKAGNSTAHAITGEDPLRQEGCPAGAEQHTTTSQASRVEAALKQGEFDSGTVEHTATHLISDTLQDQDTLGKVDIGTKADEKQESTFPFGELWPDPCLEFAYKTLTGAIPMDDNLAGAIPISDPCLEFAYKTLIGELPVEDNLAAAIPTSDPCLEFAYKTLTGEISLEDSLAVQDYFQNQMSSTHTKNNSMELPDFNVDDLYQNDIQFDSIVKPVYPNQVQNQTSRVSTSESEQGFSKESVQRPSVNKEKMDCNRKEVNP